MRSSISPVKSFGLTVSGVRLTTRPVKVMTLSSRTASISRNKTLEVSITHCVIPADFVVADTDFIRFMAYWPQLSLLELAGPAEAAAIDTLVGDIDLSPLIELLAESRLLKVFHAARQDIEIFYHLSGRVPAP